MNILASLKKKAKILKNQVLTLHHAGRDQRTPWYAKALVGLVVAYALSPVDLIPDFIPILGLLDDLVLLPVGITLAIKLIPKEVFADASRKAEEQSTRPVVGWFVFVAIGIWLLGVLLLALIICKAFM